MLGLRKPISIRWILWGHGIVCERWARDNNLRKADYTWIPGHNAERALNGIEGPLRNSQTPWRLVILPGYGWYPSERDLEYAWARGFDPDVCIVRD